MYKSESDNNEINHIGDYYTEEQLEIINAILDEKISHHTLTQLISPKMSVDALTMLYFYIRRNIHIDKIKKYFNGDYDVYKISEIYLSYINRIPEYLIERYDKPEYSSSLMESIRKCLFDKTYRVELVRYLLDTKDYTEQEMVKILNWVSCGLKKEKIDIITQKDIHPDKAECILTAIYRKYPEEALELLNTEGLPIESMELIMDALKSNIPVERIKMYVDLKHPPKLLEIIFDALRYKLDDNVIQKIINISNTPDGIKMALMEYTSYILRNNIKGKLLNGVKDINLYDKKIRETIFQFIYRGISVDKLNKYINPTMSEDDIFAMIYFIYVSMSDETLEYILSEQTKNISKKLFIKALKITDDDIKSIFRPEYDQEQIDVLCDIFSKKPPEWLKTILLNPDFNVDRMCSIFRAYCLNTSQEIIKKYLIDLSSDELKINMLIETTNMNIYDDTTIQFIKSLPSLSYDQTQEVLLGIKKGLTEEQIRFYAKEDINEIIMRKIRIAYMRGLPQNEIDKLLNK